MAGRIGGSRAAIDLASPLPARGDVARQEMEEMDVAGRVRCAGGEFTRNYGSAAADSRGQVGAFCADVHVAAHDDLDLQGRTWQKEQEGEGEESGEEEHAHGRPDVDCATNMADGEGCSSVLCGACWR